MKRKSSLVVYPLLFGLYPFLNLYANNLRKTFYFSELALPIALTLLVTGAVWLILGLLLRSAARSAFICLVLQFLFFSYGHVYDFLVDTLGWDGLTDAYLLGAWLFLLLVMLLVVVKWGHRLSELNSALNLVAVVLVVFPVVSIARASHGQPVYDQTDLLGEPIDIQPVAAGYDGALPDIYYIIMDGFPREDVLAEFFEYDNRAFSDRLREMGFYVADESQTNYIHTMYSMVSSLNAGYLQTVLQNYDLEGQPWTVLNDLLGKNVLCPTFKNIGYYHIIYDNTLPAFSKSACADMVRGYGHLNQLDAILLQTTILRPLLAGTVTESYRNSQQFILDDLPEVARLPQPTFTYAHILLPHPPMVYNRYGEPVDIVDRKYWSTPGAMDPELREAYLDQTIYTAGQLEETLAEILANSKEPPIIILQSDHGSFPPTENSFGARYLRERVPILNAYYLPKGGDALLYPSISPVNSFRVVLNHYFGANLPFLEDRTYHTSMSDENAYDYVEVTHETVYEDADLKILRAWDGDRYWVQWDSRDVVEFTAEVLNAPSAEIAGTDGWSVALKAESAARHTLLLYTPDGEQVGTGYIDASTTNPYDLAAQDYEDFAAYRENAQPIPASQLLEAPNLSIRIQDADTRSIGSYISLARELDPAARNDLFDLMILLEYPAVEEEPPADLEVTRILKADYLLVKDSEKWRQETSTEDWFLLHNPSHLKHVRSWNINVGDRFEPIRYDLYQIVDGSLSRTFVLPEFYEPHTPIVISSPSRVLNKHIRQLLLTGVDPALVFDLIGLDENGVKAATIDELNQWLGDHETFWYIGAPESSAGEGVLMARLHPLGYVRGRIRGHVQPVDRDLYYSELRIFSFHRMPAQTTAPYTFGKEPIRLHSWSFETPEPLAVGQEMRLQTWWSSPRTPERYYRMSLVVSKANGEFVMQQDLNLSEVMMTEWRTDELYLDERWFILPCDLALGDYELQISLYDYDYNTGSVEGLTAHAADGSAVQTVSLAQFTVERTQSSQCGE